MVAKVLANRRCICGRVLRDELLNETLFASLAHVREALAIWKDDYNTVRPHSALGNLPPAVYAKISAPGMQRDGALRYVEGSAPRPVAPPSQQGSSSVSEWRDHCSASSARDWSDFVMERSTNEHPPA